ncbi:MAG: phosphoribosylamine--glycine ligase, partial [Bacilli bacterium]
MRILVIGQGGREHAIVWKLAQSPRVSKLYCAPGNPGIAELATVVNIAELDFAALAQFVKEEEIDLTFVGPEVPLFGGIVDYFTTRGLRIFGPTSQAAKIEGSKSFAKQLMYKYNIPTAAYASFTDYDEAVKYVETQGTPIVIKADGLTAGKGVIVAKTFEEATDALNQLLKVGTFGDAGAEVVIEEFLEGEELTLLSFVDGVTVRPMVPAQDHKAAFDGDLAPNTGGMGTYSPLPHISQEQLDEIVDS